MYLGNKYMQMKKAVNPVYNLQPLLYQICVLKNEQNNNVLHFSFKKLFVLFVIIPHSSKQFIKLLSHPFRIVKLLIFSNTYPYANRQTPLLSQFHSVVGKMAKHSGRVPFGYNFPLIHGISKFNEQNSFVLRLLFNV